MNLYQNFWAFEYKNVETKTTLDEFVLLGYANIFDTDLMSPTTTGYGQQAGGTHPTAMHSYYNYIDICVFCSKLS